MSTQTTEPFVRSPLWWFTRLEGKGMHLALLAALSKHADKDTNTCYPSQGALADFLGRSRPWVNSAIKELEQLGLLKKTYQTITTRRGQATTSCLYEVIYQETTAAGEVGQVAVREDKISNVSPLTPPVKQADTNKNPINKSLSEISIDDWKPAASTLTALTNALGADAGDRYLAKFRAKVAERGYQYADFDVALLYWLDADRKRELLGKPQSEKSAARARTRQAKEQPAKIDTDVEAFVDAADQMPAEVKTAVYAMLTGTAPAAFVSEGARFKAACLMLAKDRGLDFYRAWLSQLDLSSISDGTLLVGGGSSYGRRFVSEKCEGTIARACRAAGLRFERLRFS